MESETALTNETRQLWHAIEARCAELGCDVTELAKRARVSRTTLFKFANGRTAKPRFSTLLRIAEALETTPEALLDHAPRQRGKTELPIITMRRDASSREFDKDTNPLVAEYCGNNRHLFAGWSSSDWDELHSEFGTGGALNETGVALAVQRINEKRECLRKVSVLLETHLGEVTSEMVNCLFRMVQPARGQSHSRKASNPAEIQ